MSDKLVSEQDLLALITKQSISELVYSYSRAVDRRDFALLRALYTEDGSDDHGHLFCGDASSYIDWLEQAMQNTDITSHAVHNHLIALTDENSAEGEVYVTAYHRNRDSQYGMVEYIGGFRYLDQYRREQGRWRFAHRKLIHDWYRIAPACWDLNHPLLSGSPIGLANGDDPSYQLTHPFFARS